MPQIPGAQAWLPARPCKALVPAMDFSPVTPSAFLPSPASLGSWSSALTPEMAVVFPPSVALVLKEDLVQLA